MKTTLRKRDRAAGRQALRSRLGAALVVALLPAVTAAQQTTRASVDSSGAQGDDASDFAVISADGRYVLLVSDASNLVVNDGNGTEDVFVRDRATGVTECVSVDPAGIPGNAASGGQPDLFSISADGRFVSFVSAATNLVSGLTTTSSQIFVRDRVAGTTELASVDSTGVEGNSFSGSSSISGDGRYVAFDSNSSNLVAGDTNQTDDVFVRDRTMATTERVSIDSSGNESVGGGYWPTISADGGVVTFTSAASDLVPNDRNHTEDAFVHDRQTGATERVSIDSGGIEGNGDTVAGWLSADGQIAVFVSLASNLVSGDTNGKWDIFVRDRTAGVTERVSVDSSGGEGNGASIAPTISADGNMVAFISDAPNLVPGDANGVVDGFVHDRSSGITTRWSTDSSGAEGNGGCWSIIVSADGRAAAFSSQATNLVSGDTNGFTDVFVRDDRIANWTNYGSGFPGTNGVPSLTSNSNPVIGTTMSIDVDNSWQQPTAGLLFAGVQRADIHSSWGGDLLVAPILTVPISFSYGHDQFDWSIPLDFALLGVVIDLQAIEADPGAVKAVSFTPGLELVVGL